MNRASAVAATASALYSVGTVRARQLLYAQEVKLRYEAAAEAQAEGREAPYPPPKRPAGSSKHFLDQALDRE